MADDRWTIETGEGPIVATAVHDGHALRDEVAELSALDDDARLREEDPHTGHLASVAGTRVIPRQSRFEVDLNRPRDKAVYARPEDAWGLDLWKRPPAPELIEGSLAVYDAFFQDLHRVLSDVEHRHGRFVVLDLHSYNHLRDGPDGAPADPAGNPEVNIGTGSMNRESWAPVVERFMADLRAADFMGRHLDVRENVKFRGANVGAFTHRNFPRSGCALSVEFKKIFMDEWTGEVDETAFGAIGCALRSTIPGLVEELALLEARR